MLTRLFPRSGMAGSRWLGCVAAIAMVLPATMVLSEGKDVFPIDGPAQIMPLAPKRLLLDVVHNGNQLVAVGERGHILLSKDGKNWTQSPVPTRSTLTGLAFTSAQNGWAVGHDAVILRTTDGGASWEKQFFAPELERPFLDILFTDQQNGIAIGAYGLMMTTSDGGETWEDSAASIREDEWHFNAITELGNGDLFIVGEVGNMAVSNDGGETWTKVMGEYDGSYFGVIPSGERGAIIYGLRGNAYMISDVYGAAEAPEVEEVAEDVAEAAAEEGAEGAAEAAEDAAEAIAEAAPTAQWEKLPTQTILGLLGGTQLPNGDVLIVGTNGIILHGQGSPKNLQKVKNMAGVSLSGALPLDGGVLVIGENGASILAL